MNEKNQEEIRSKKNKNRRETARRKERKQQGKTITA
tara:strand:+ start:3453 stop:3560 length:108 start_codon:yes stop_codon:yes gene_type:complete